MSRRRFARIVDRTEREIYFFEKMSYFQEDMNEDPFFSDKSGDEEVLENDRFEEDSFQVPFCYDPLRPAYLQLPLGMAEIPAKTEQLHRQAWMKSKKNKKRKAEDKTSEPKTCCLGGRHSKTHTNNNNLYGFDCGSTVEEEGAGMLCDCGLFICYQCLRKIELMVKNNQVVFQKVPDYLDLMFHAMRGRQRNI